MKFRRSNPQVKIIYSEHNTFVFGIITVIVKATNVSGIVKVELYVACQCITSTWTRRNGLCEWLGLKHCML
ncbi:hypothetical protein HER11_05000 [Fervidobacterium pennivorans subsp. keratinolyticus]|nr:hypothetical protein HER11_05000 [Fervidobacterium pennivorans subsp. keratinolyticus]